MSIVDAHLDLSYNVLRGRDVTKPAREQPTSLTKPRQWACLICEGNVGLICATIFCPPGIYRSFGYTTGGRNAADGDDPAQLVSPAGGGGVAEFREEQADLPSPRDETAAGPLAAIMLMEGADAPRSPADVPEWFEYGLRIVGLAWRRTRSAGGTGEPGPLTDEGRGLVGVRRGGDHPRHIAPGG